MKKRFLQLFTFLILFTLNVNISQAQNFSEDFEAGEMPAGFTLFNVDGLIPALEDDISWQDTAWIVLGSTLFEGSAALSISWYWDENENDVGPADDWLILPKLTIDDNAVLRFDARSATSTGDFPDDYWVLINTADATPESFESDGAILLQIDDEESMNFRTEEIDLADYAGQEVYIAFRNVTNGDGYGLWIDNIFVGDPNATSTENVEPAYFKASLQPNPAHLESILQYTLNQTSRVQINVFNALGQQVSTQQLGQQIAGEHQFSLPVNNLQSGTYTVQFRAEDKVSSLRLVVAPNQ